MRRLSLTSVRARVLLVESFADDRGMYAEYLRYCGYDPIECDNAADALARAPEADVIVTGVRIMGPVDGIELVRRLRDEARTRDKALIVLTACALEPDRRRAQAAGCDAFLPKPCLPDMLVDEVRRALRARGRRNVKAHWPAAVAYRPRRGG